MTGSHRGDALRPSVLAQVGVLVLLVAIPLGIGFAGSMVTVDNVDGWYANADKAPWTPPNEVFGPTWSALYIIMGVASWLVWRLYRSEEVRRPLGLYATQLILNGLWTPVFFGLYPSLGSAALWVACAIMAALIVALLATIRAFKPVSSVAAWLLVPYLLWLVYASTLNVYAAIFN
jgi:tryptophan-rich sensory protein